VISARKLLQKENRRVSRTGISLSLSLFLRIARNLLAMEIIIEETLETLGNIWAKHGFYPRANYTCTQRKWIRAFGKLGSLYIGSRYLIR